MNNVTTRLHPCNNTVLVNCHACGLRRWLPVHVDYNLKWSIYTGDRSKWPQILHIMGFTTTGGDLNTGSPG